MTDLDTVDERLRAVERAISDGDADDVALTDPTGELTERIETLEADLAELDAAVQAIRGYVGHIRSLDESVEQEADSALAAVDDLRERVDRLETDGSTGDRPPARSEDAPSDGPSPSNRPHDRSTTSRGRTSTDGGTAGQGYETKHAPRQEPHHPSAADCPYCGSARNCPPLQAPAGEREVRPRSVRDRPAREEGQTTTGSPVEDVDEDGLVDRLRGKL